MTEDSKSLDILGIKPIADSINKVTTATLDGAAAFLSRICLPAAEEFGLLLRDRVRAWRASNIAAITQRAAERLENADAPDNVHAHPRLVSNILDEGSWIEDTVVQDLWGGLLASSCTTDGDDDSNLIFVNLLSELTKLEAKILRYVCEHAEKNVAPNGLIQAESFDLTLDTLREVSGDDDLHRLDRELDHLRSLQLIDIASGFQFGATTDARTTPTALALHMYVRCQGCRQSAVEYFGLEVPQPSQEPNEDAS